MKMELQEKSLSDASNRRVDASLTSVLASAYRMEESSQKIFLRVPESLKEEWKLFCDAIGQNQNRAGTSLVEWILRLPTRDAQLLVLKISDPSREERERILREILKVDTFSPAPSNRLPEKPKPKIPRKRVNHDGTLS